MKKKIIYNYILMVLSILIALGISIFVMYNRFTLDNITSLDILIGVGTPFILALIVVGVFKGCLGSIAHMKEYVKISLECKNEVMEVGKNYKANNEYIIKASSTLTFFFIIGGIILIICGVNAVINFMLGLVLGIILLVLSPIAFIVYLYYRKVNSYNDYEIGSMYIKKLRNEK